MFENSSENSIDNGMFSNSPPYLLTLEVEELISPPNNTRWVRRNPSPTRPLNKYLIFRRDFTAKMRQQGMEMTARNVSRLSREAWDKQPAKVIRYFEILENLARDKHNEIYPASR
ncbi:hypothetical protein C2G38_1424384 [Gigaspora rosea]|uniref:HMG box domain-containing protein n=1 Tax=Gigaspora rosea TaxID=44941 RepID=A0A397W8U5_9GLOM|nr:hypothetical protein C2G38_1424384 [Gigaspora rosea]CAG8652301.1 5188_t:CDS:1 [Gigaspora rosea]